jgi:signal peptidase I
MSSPAASDIRSLKCEMAAEVLRSCGSLCTRVTGRSMLPTIWPGDTLMIKRTAGNDLAEGDIVWFRRGDRFVVHRVVTVMKRESDGRPMAQTQGDAAPRPDSPISDGDVLGKVGYVVRNGRRITPSRNLRLSERALAKLIQHSHIAARVIVCVHQMLERSQVQNSPDRVVRYQSEPCQS